MSGQGIQTILPRAVFLIGAGALLAAGLYFRTIDVSAAAAGETAAEMTIPPPPPVAELPPMATDAFVRPVFHRTRAPGPDKAPATVSDDTTPAAPDAPDEPVSAEGFSLKGVIIGDRGARVALQAPGAAGPVWAKVGQVVEGWTVVSISTQRVRLRNGSETVDINFNGK